ncbi:phospholipase A(1) DAD1, chloroplastic-like [Senna tora]|uniref:Phospholipase A(1) DAD1, chloroplastic-like n=1 Tax=Senna tora TaxID=362788 RepID=A0A835CKS0_9FABA|nr:phospholipase A(1) DAD1, chloroplastic-like [Senna tora]
MEYQGSTNWEGLLDPLDHNLRAEILRYGRFVEAAYATSCRFPENTPFRGSGYRVTKRLRATSGIKLPKSSWFETTPSSSSYIGYVAVCDDEEEIKRLGRRDVVVAYRGTTTCLEWLENFRTNLTRVNNSSSGGAMVQRGFLSLYTSSTSSSLQRMVREEIGRIVRAHGGGDEPISVTVTGHSLGAALAILTAHDVKAATGIPTVTAITFGGPRVGNARFREMVERGGTKVLRVVNTEDVVTKVPGFVGIGGEGDVARGGGAHVARWLGEWGRYAEVGKELRLCSRDSPYLSGMNVATCHDLKTYLHLVDGFVSSTCPFRATAKRLRDLDQRKKLGTKKTAQSCAKLKKIAIDGLKKNEGNTWTLNNSYQPSICLVTSYLTGSNFLSWSLAVKKAIEAKGKISFIDRSIKSLILLKMSSRSGNQLIPW